jgi:hypothetical protein
MSTLRIGANLETSDNKLTGYIDTLAKWIPGDVIAFYVAGIAALRSTLEPLAGQSEVLESQATPGAGWLLLGAAGLTIVLTVIGAIKGGPDNKPPPATRKDVGRVAVLVLLSTAAFIVWSLVIPQTWWTKQGLDVAIASLVVAGFALAYVPVAELIAGYVRAKMGT